MRSASERKRRPRLAAAAALALALAGGCGPYSATSGRIDPALKLVAVPFLENQSTEPGIEVQLTDAIVRALQDDNTLSVTDEEHAATVLRGKVLRYRLQEAFSKPGSQTIQVDEYQVQILVELSLVRRVSGEPLFEKRRLSGTGNFSLNDPNGTSEQTAREEAAREIVREVLALVVEDW